MYKMDNVIYCDREIQIGEFKFTDRGENSRKIMREIEKEPKEYWMTSANALKTIDDIVDIRKMAYASDRERSAVLLTYFGIVATAKTAGYSPMVACVYNPNVAINFDKCHIYGFDGPKVSVTVRFEKIALGMISLTHGNNSEFFMLEFLRSMQPPENANRTLPAPVIEPPPLPAPIPKPKEPNPALANLPWNVETAGSWWMNQDFTDLETVPHVISYLASPKYTETDIQISRIGKRLKMITLGDITGELLQHIHAAPPIEESRKCVTGQTPNVTGAPAGAPWSGVIHQGVSSFDIVPECEDGSREIVIMLAGQFNGLESTSSNYMPLSKYPNDRSQGPQASISCMVLAQYRDKSLIPDQQDLLLDLQDQILEESEFCDYFYKNGYLELFRMDDLSKERFYCKLHDQYENMKILVAETYPNLRPNPLLGVRGSAGAGARESASVSAGANARTSVSARASASVSASASASAAANLPVSETDMPYRMSVTQVVCAAPSFQDADDSYVLDSMDRAICKLLLIKQYFAVAKIAVIKSLSMKRKVVCHFTLLGMGAFGNPPEIVVDALTGAIAMCERHNVDVVVHAWGYNDHHALVEHMHAGTFHNMDAKGHARN